MSQYSRVTVHTISLNSLPELDFSKIESSCGLTFDGRQRLDLQCAVAEYNNAKVAFENIPAKDVKAYLSKVIQSIDVLTPILAVANPGGDPDINSKSVFQSIWFHTRPYQRYHPGEFVIKRYLEDWKDRALEAKELKGHPGQPRDFVLQTLIMFASPVYESAGGALPGCFANIQSDNHYSGPFYGLVCEIVRQTDGCVMAPSGIGKAILSWRRKVLSKTQTN